MPRLRGSVGISDRPAIQESLHRHAGDVAVVVSFYCMLSNSAIAVAAASPMARLMMAGVAPSLIFRVKTATK
jgi:hypothetical protein